MELLVLIGTGVGVAICLALVVALPFIGKVTVGWLNFRFWLRKNYPDREEWPDGVHDVIYLPVVVDYFKFPLSAWMLGPLALGMIIIGIGEGVEVTAVTVIGRVIVFAPALFFYSLIAGTLSEAMMKEPPPPMVRKARSEKALQSLKKKCKSDAGDMKDLYRLWLNCFSHEKLAARFSDQGDLFGKYHRFLKGFALPERLAAKIDGTIQRYRSRYVQLLDAGLLSASMTHFVERQIRRLDALSVKIATPAKE